MNRARAIEILRSLRPRLEARGIVRAGIFGSVGRDAASTRSDIDIVVTPEKDRRFDLIDLGGVQSLWKRALPAWTWMSWSSRSGAPS